MSFFDNLRQLTSSIPGAQSVLNTAQHISKVAYPIELQNLEKTQADIRQKLSSFGQQNETKENLEHLQIYFTNHSHNLENGGEPAPDALKATQIKAMPQYQQLMQELPTLKAQLDGLAGSTD